MFTSQLLFTVPLHWEQRALKVLGRIPASKVAFAQFRIFPDFPSTFVEPKIYLYLTDSNFFGCFEKLWVWIVHFCCLSPAEQEYDTPWYLFFGKEFLVNFLWFFVRFWLNRFQSFFIYPSEGYPMCPPTTKNTGNRRLISHLSSPENLTWIHQETKKLGRITFWGENSWVPPHFHMILS